VANAIGETGNGKRPSSEIGSANTPSMSPRPYGQWRADPIERDEDATEAARASAMEAVAT
jgi:hypothetical protein